MAIHGRCLLNANGYATLQSAWPWVKHPCALQRSFPVAPKGRLIAVLDDAIRRYSAKFLFEYVTGQFGIGRQTDLPENARPVGAHRFYAQVQLLADVGERDAFAQQ